MQLDRDERPELIEPNYQALTEFRHGEGQIHKTTKNWCSVSQANRSTVEVGQAGVV